MKKDNDLEGHGQDRQVNENTTYETDTEGHGVWQNVNEAATDEDTKARP